MIGASSAVAKGGAGGVIGALKSNAGTIANGVGIAGAFVGFDVGEDIAEDLGLEDKPFFKLGIQMGTSIMTGMAFQMATTAAIGKIINVIRGLALSAAMNEALKSTGFKMGAAMQKGLLVGLSVGMIAAISTLVSKAAKTAVDSILDSTGRFFTGDTANEQQDNKIASARKNKNLVSGIAGGFINLDKASLDTLIMLSKDIASLKEDKLFEIPASLSQLVSGKSNLEVAIEKLEKTLEDKGINVEIAKKSFGGATPPGYGAVAQFSTGGPVNGIGTGTSDDIPAMLSDGEFVMKQAAVQKFGSGFMNAINNGIMPKFRANGGDIGRFTLGGQAQEIAIELRRDDLDVKERKALVAQLERITRLTEQQTADLTAGGAKGNAALDNLKVTSESAQKYAEDFNNSLANALSRALHGDDLGDIGDALLDTFTSTVINAFSTSFADKFLENFSFDTLFDGIESLGGKVGGAAKGDFGGFGSKKKKSSGNSSGYGDDDAGQGIGQSISESLGGTFDGFFSSFDGILGGISGIFGGLTDSLGGLFSGLGSSLSGLFGGGGGGGMDVGDIIMKGIGFFGFSQGGIVPATANSQAGKDSVPAMLMPGEVVLSKNDLRNMDANKGSSQQSFNINVQGDVSRQTRSEIVKMMPQIAGGVNAQNKENNFRR
jgi:hypothetical protein